MRLKSWKAVAVAGIAVPVFVASQTATPIAGGQPILARGQVPLSTAAAARLAQDVTKPVIVVLKNQHTEIPVRSASASRRQKTLTAEQAPLTDELHATAAKNIRTYQTINAVAATVSPGEADRLAANPNVAQVVPDVIIKRPAVNTSAVAAAAPSASPLPGACATDPSKPMLEPEALPVTHTASDDPHAQTAHGLGFTGKGVKVAFIAEGIDTNNPDFIRPDGSPVFVDYQDFSGDGPNAPTPAGEAFLDASAIAAQGRKTYDVSQYSATTLSKPCPIRILGASPGASLVGLKVFASSNATTQSAFLQAIDYAVNVAHVDILNESFGANPFPDVGSQDVTRLFDRMAVEAGVTVVVSSGDAGITNTIGSPATDPAVISVGGTTTFRWYAQTGYGGARFATHGWINDNITSLSSGGVSQSGRTVDLVAPGDSSFALCTPNTKLYVDCVDFNKKPSPVERSGGTSESAPLTAGAAALVIEAYRSTHHGASPTPAMIKQILTSTADDLGVPADEQGAGRLNSYKAVQAASSIADGHGQPKPQGSTLLTSTGQLNAVAAPGTSNTFPVTLTNTGAATQTVSIHGRQLGPQEHKSTQKVVLSEKSSPHFTDWQGSTNNYAQFPFDVPPGQDRLDASIAYQADPARGLNARVRLILIDPMGNYAAHSLPQGIGNYGNVDVRYPAFGTWTAVIFSKNTAAGGTTGPVLFQSTTATYQPFASVNPSSLTLAPGQSGTFTVAATTPSQPGDTSASIELDAPFGQRTSIPLILRSLVDPGRGGAFSGVLTGGNGREIVTGQTNYFQFDVPPGQRDLDASVNLTTDANNPVWASLISPEGQTLGYSSNQQVIGFDSLGLPITRFIKATQLYHRNPKPGRWTLIVNFAPLVSGKELSQPFNGKIQFNQVDISAVGLPNDPATVLPAGKPVKVQLRIHNTGVAPESFFVDGRLDKKDTLVLTPIQAATDVVMPVSPTTPTPAWLVPTETDALAVAAEATVPVTFDYGWNYGAGDPDLSATSYGNVATAAFTANPVAPGLWFANPAEIGPFGDGGAPAGTANLAMVAHTKLFDPAITSDTGDLWKASVDPLASVSLLIINPNETKTITVTITPSGKKGDVVKGHLYADDVTFANIVGNGLPNGDELIGFPYAYRIG